MKKTIALLFGFLSLCPLALGRTNNNVYVIPNSSLVANWGQVNLGSTNAVTGESAGACYATSSTSGLLFGSLPTADGGLGGNFGSSTGALSIASGTVTAGIQSVPNGGTGVGSLTAYSVIIAGTTSTGAFQAVGPGTSGQTLISNGASAAGTFQSFTAQPGLAMSSSSGNDRIERIRFGGATENTNDCTSSPCTIYRQSGNWVGASGVTRNSSGNYTITFASAFSAAPVCVCSSQRVTNHGTICSNYVPTTNTIGVSTFDSTTSTNFDSTVDLYCFGPR